MDIVCFSHLRWNFVYQRPQHLLSRFARDSTVFFIEEPLFDATTPFIDTVISKEGVRVMTLHLQTGLDESGILAAQRELLSEFFSRSYELKDYIAWFYTPLALDISDALPSAALTVYDCMDELSAFKNAPPAITQKESVLMGKADLVFTGGHSLYEAKKHLHKSIHPFPSSIDKAHFGQARNSLPVPPDQQSVPGPRIGFFGVVDERFDIDLIAETARLRTDWHFIIIGPIVKIDPVTLPTLPNIHYIGGKRNRVDAIRQHMCVLTVFINRVSGIEYVRLIVHTGTGFTTYCIGNRCCIAQCLTIIDTHIKSQSVL